MSDSINNIYIQALNNAYLLSKYKSKLIDTILKSPNDSIYFQGLRDGKKIYDLQHDKSRLRDLERLRNKSTRDRGLERGSQSHK